MPENSTCLFHRIFCEFSLFGCGCEGVRVYQCFPHLSPWSDQPRSSQHFDLISCHIIKCPQSPARWSQSRPRQMVERWQYQGITPDSTRGMGQSPHQTGIRIKYWIVFLFLSSPFSSPLIICHYRVRGYGSIINPHNTFKSNAKILILLDFIWITLSLTE